MITALMHFTLQRSSDENVKRVTVTSHRSGVTTVSDLAISTSLGFGSPRDCRGFQFTSLLAVFKGEHQFN